MQTITPLPQSIWAPMTLELRVTDAEVLAELRRQPEQDRDAYALCALRVGVMALHQSRGELDASTVRQEGTRLIEEIRCALLQHATSVNHDLAAELARYFDPATGNLTQRIERLAKSGGDLDGVLSQHLNGTDGTMARTLAQHVGEQSPIFKLLSPGQGDGLLAAIEGGVEDVLRQQREAVAAEFSLDQPASALNKLLRELTTANGKLKAEFQLDLQAVVSQFSLDDPNSALSRLVAQVDVAKRGITEQFSLDDETSSLSRLQRGVDGRLAELVKSQHDFQTEVRETLAGLAATRHQRLASSLHGIDFESRVGELVSRFATERGHICEATGNFPGRNGRSKVGDYCLTLSQDSIAAGANIVVEAKEDASYTLMKALAEIGSARANRGAAVGVFVFSARVAPTNVPPLSRFGRDIVVVWDGECQDSNVVLTTALCLAVALCTADHASHDGEGLDFAAMDRSIEKITAAIKDVADIRKLGESVRMSGAKICEQSERVRSVLESECGDIRRLVDAVRGATSPTEV